MADGKQDGGRLEANESSDSVDGITLVAEELQARLSISPTQGFRRGKCKWFNVQKGWGFITPDDGGQDVFVHQSVIQMGGFRSLGESEEVDFECRYTDKGLEATKVQGPSGVIQGSSVRPKKKRLYRKIRCYNCGEFENHIAIKCPYPIISKRCHNCRCSDHLVADCPLPRVVKKYPGTSKEGTSVSDVDTASTEKTSP